MVIRAVFMSSTVLKTPAIFFPPHSKQIQHLRHSDRVEAFDWLSVGAFVYQPIRMLCFVTSFCTELTYFCTKFPHFCIKFTKNCISLSQSDSKFFFMYIIIQLSMPRDMHELKRLRTTTNEMILNVTFSALYI